MSSVKRLIIVLVVLLIGAVTVAIAISVYRLYIPQTVEVAVTLPASIRVTIGGVEVENGTMIDWGTLNRGGSAHKSVSIRNNGDHAVTVYIRADLPPWWTLDADWNGTRLTLGGGSILTWMELTAPSDADLGTYTFDAWIIFKPG